MTVIGRLDEQVDRVLISPLAQKAAKNVDAQSANTGDKEAHPEAESQPAGEEIYTARGAGRGELPVWLL